METKVTCQSKAQASREFSKKLLMLVAEGGAAFWIIDFVIATGMNAPRFLALGLVIGYLFDKQKGKV